MGYQLLLYNLPSKQRTQFKRTATRFAFLMHGTSVKASSVSTKTKSTSKIKAKSQKPAVSSRFNYFVQCKHDLKHAASCPMCKLATIVTRQHFQDEKDNLDRAHEQSLINRAQLRLTLMMRWARSQSALYNKFAPTPTFDVVFSKSLAMLLVDEDAVGSRANPIDFDEIVKILNRRNRIQEVGHFAAIFLQTRIRKYLAKRYVRRLMLQRFEYVPATRRKEAFYVDNYWMRKWIRTPRYLQDEAPATPRTLSRRLAADDRVREARFERYQKAMARQFTTLDDVWAQEETTVRFLKQLSVLRDVVRIAMLTLTRNQLRRAATANAAAEKAAEARRTGAASTPGGSGGAPNARRPSTMGRSAFAQVLQEEAQKLQPPPVVPELEMDTVDIPLQPVWICLSAPACSARQLGLQLVLATVPSPATGAVAVLTEGDGIPRFSAAAAVPTAGGMLRQGSQDSASMFPNVGRPVLSAKIPKLDTTAGLGNSSSLLANSVSMSGKANIAPRMQGSPPRTPGKSPAGARRGNGSGTGAGMITGVAQLQRALQFLDSSIWLCLKCSTPEEVLGKLVLEDLRPTFESVMNISQEPKQIWHGNMGYLPHGAFRTIATRGEPGREQGGDDSSAFSTPLDSVNNALVSLGLGEGGTVGSLSLDEYLEGEGEEDEFSHEVLPLTLQLRPYYADRGCNGFFRLFFYMDELVVVSACSPWTFYPEVQKNRDLINNSLRAYASLPATKAFVQYFLARANVHTIGQSTSHADDNTSSGASSQTVKAGIAASQGSTKQARRGSVGPASSSASAGRRKAGSGLAVNTGPSLPVQQTDLSSLFAPPEEIIYGSHAPDRAAIQRMRDIAQFTDDKTLYMAKQYSFMTKNPVFAERLKRAEHNVANRLKRRGAATSAPTKAFTDASPYHQRLAQFEAWRESDPYLSLAVLNNNKIGSGATSAAGVGEQNDEQLVRDLHAVKSDLIGKKVLALLRGAEDVHGDVENGGDVVNVFDQRVTSETASSVEQPSRRGSLGAMSLHTTESEESAVAVVKTGEDEDGGLGGEEGNEGGGSVRLSIMDGSLQPSTDTSVTEETSTAMTVSVDERNLSEYEAKLHRYSSKVKMEISERLRKPSDVNQAKELFPLVVMDVYVQLPGKAGLGNLGNLGGTASSGLGGGPSSTPAGLRRTQTENSGGSLGSGAGAAPAGTPGGGFGGGASAGSTGGLLGIDLHQIVGAFSCDTDRPPPNLDCALSDWEHFYAIHQQRVAAHQQQQQQQNPRNANTPNSTSLFDLMAAGDSFSMASGVASELSSPIGRSVGSSKGGGGGGFSMAGSTANTKGGWTPTNADTGVSTYLTMLPSGLQFQCHLLGAAPSKTHLERVLPKKVKEWLGLPV